MKPRTNEFSTRQGGSAMRLVLRLSAQDRRRGEPGQFMVLFALVLFFAIIPMCALVLEAGNAYAQQRVVQNGADATANAGAVRLGQRLAGVATTDGEVLGAMTTVSTANSMDSFVADYTDVQGRSLNVQVGSGSIPAGAQGVAVRGDRTFPTFIGRAIGFNSFVAGADATAITGRLAGGQFLPVVLPVSIVDCTTNGSLGTVPENQWVLAQPPVGTAKTPTGIEYIIPLCKTGGGSFQILDLDPTQRCDDEVANMPLIYWPVLPVVVDSDNGNNCAKPIADWVNNELKGKTVLIPICDNSTSPCGTTGGSHATYTITRVAAFFIDYMDDSNNQNNSNCQSHVSGTGQQLVTIAGNGSSSCLAGWFVRYIDVGPVDQSMIGIGNSDAIGVQLIR